MFKNYDITTEVNAIVHQHVLHGLSRHQNKEFARSFVVSIGTEYAHKSALTSYARWLLATKNKRLKKSTPADAKEFLGWRAASFRQSTVSLARQAINLHLHSASPVDFVPAKVATQAANRAYSAQQIELLVQEASPALRLSILLCTDAGLRGMELLTIGRPDEQQVSLRVWSSSLFRGRENDIAYVVRGKGKLFRELRLQPSLASQLEATRRSQAVVVSHRKGHLPSWFDLLGGHDFSIAFGNFSRRVLGFSHGAHGLRHAFAQRRRDELLCAGVEYDLALEVLSQELGHFATKNTLAYLRDMGAPTSRKNKRIP